MTKFEPTPDQIKFWKDSALEEANGDLSKAQKLYDRFLRVAEHSNNLSEGFSGSVLPSPSTLNFRRGFHGRQL